MIANQPECVECGGACCEPSRLRFPVPHHVSTCSDARNWLNNMGLRDAEVQGVLKYDHGRTVISTDCRRRGSCDEATRPEACLSFPLHYFDDDHTDAERDEIRPFCPLFRRLELEIA